MEKVGGHFCLKNVLYLARLATFSFSEKFCEKMDISAKSRAKHHRVLGQAFGKKTPFRPQIELI